MEAGGERGTSGTEEAGVVNTPVVRAWRDGRAVCLAPRPEVARRVRAVLGDFERALTGRRRSVFARRPRPIPDRRLFPDTYTDSEQSARFRAQHGAGMRERLLGAVRRTARTLDEVLATESEEPVAILEDELVADVFAALGQAQVLFLTRPRWAERVDWSTVPTLRHGTDLLWLTACRSVLAEAALAEPGEETLFTA